MQQLYLNCSNFIKNEAKIYKNTANLLQMQQLYIIFRCPMWATVDKQCVYELNYVIYYAFIYGTHVCNIFNFFHTDTTYCNILFYPFLSVPRYDIYLILQLPMLLDIFIREGRQ